MPLLYGQKHMQVADKVTEQTCSYLVTLVCACLGCDHVGDPEFFSTPVYDGRKNADPRPIGRVTILARGWNETSPRLLQRLHDARLAIC